MTETPDLNIALEEIPALPFTKLRELYCYLFNHNIKSTRREFFVWRVTNRLQELRFGGLDCKTRTLLERMEDNAQPKEKTLPVGTEITKKYKGNTYRLRVVFGGFEMDGDFYKSLSAVAFKITGRKISGKDFWGV